MASFSCAPTPTESNDPASYLNEAALYSHNVAGLYSAAPTQNGVELQWKDSTGLLRSLSHYQGRPALVLFWRTNSASSVQEALTADSLQQAMKDSVKVLAIAIDNTPSSFKTVSDFVQAHSFGLQIVVDSAAAAFRQFVVFSTDNTLGVPESFILSKQGSVVGIEEGWFSQADLAAELRKRF